MLVHKSFFISSLLILGGAEGGKGAKKEKSATKKGKSAKSMKGDGPSRCEPGSTYITPTVPGNNGYCPGQDNVDAWVNAQRTWGQNGYPAGLPPPYGNETDESKILPTLELWQYDDPDILFCFNSNCGANSNLTGIEEIVARVRGLSVAYGDTYNFEVFEWTSAPGLLFVTRAVETLSDQCGTIFKLNFQAVWYYNDDGKVQAMQIFVFPPTDFENFIVNMFQCPNLQFPPG